MAYIQKVSASATGSASSPSLTGVTAGNSLAFMVSAYNISDVVPTDSAGQTWLKADYQQYSGAGNAYYAIYYLLNANAGTHTLSWTGDNAGTYMMYTLVEFPACSAINVVGTRATANGNPTSLTANATVSANVAMLALLEIDSQALTSNQHISDPATGGWTTLYTENDSNSYEAGQHCYQESVAGGAVSAGWTFDADASGQSAIGVIVSFLLSGGGGGGFQPAWAANSNSIIQSGAQR